MKEKVALNNYKFESNQKSVQVDSMNWFGLKVLMYLFAKIQLQLTKTALLL